MWPEGRDGYSNSICAPGAAEPGSLAYPGGNARLTLLQFSTDSLAAKLCNGQMVASGLRFLLPHHCLPSPRPSGRSVVVFGPGMACQGRCFS
jgi:hypothetical protein